MSERTIITTIEITDVQKNVPECYELDKKEWRKGTIELVKSAIQCDDVVVTNVQEFVLGDEE